MTAKFNSSFHLGLLLLLSSFSVLTYKGRGEDEPLVPGMFVFGGSFVDIGNNYFIRAAQLRADYYPYAVDLSPGILGRFSNGKNFIDGLTNVLNLNPLPAFLDPDAKGSKIIEGVNYASGGSGILNETGSQMGHVISMKQQINNFEAVTLPSLSKQLNCGSQDCLTAELSKYLFVIGTGGGDYIFNYFRLPAGTKTPLRAFTSELIRTLSVEHIKRLYTLGARKFVLTTMEPLGCTPYAKMAGSKANRNGCINHKNKAAILFNKKLKATVDSLKKDLSGTNLVYLSTFQIISDILKNPKAQGIVDVSTSCCKVSASNKGGNGVLCDKGGSVCSDRKTQLFFDALHPTEAVNFLIASKAFSSGLASEVYPINLQQLAKL